MILELHRVSLGQHIRSLSLTVEGGQLLCLTGEPHCGKTTLLRAILGFIPVDEGFVCIDGELMTPQSAPYFRRQTAYVPQHLSVPEGYGDSHLESWPDLSTDDRYLLLLEHAVASGKPLLIVDESPQPLGDDARRSVETLLLQAVQGGATVLAVNSWIQHNQLKL